MTRKQLFNKLLIVFCVLAGSLIMAIGTAVFLRPFDIVTGGFTGIATILNAKVIKFLSIGVIVLIMNLPLYLIAFRKLGIEFIVFSIIGTVGYAIFIDIILAINLNWYNITNGNLLLAALYGGALLGIGDGFIVRCGGSTGGSDMLATLIHHKRPNFSFGAVLFVIDALVVFFSALAFGIDKALYAFISIFLSSRIINHVIDGRRGVRAYFVVSSMPQEVGKAILEKMNRGVTALKGTGMYTQNERNVLLCLILRFQSRQLKQIVYQIDSKAFIFSVNASEIYGEGFKPFNGKIS